MQGRGRVIPAAVASGAAAFPPRKPGDPTRPFRIVCCGRLAPEKDFATAIRAVSIVRSCSLPPGAPGVQLELIGDGPLRSDLEQLATSLELKDQVVFRGGLPHARVLEKFYGADLAILPSRFEGLGMAAMESMAVGTPTITSDFEASSEFIEHGRTGHRFPTGDVQTLARLISWHLQNREESHRIGTAGRQSIVNQFHPRCTIEQYLEIYRSLVPREAGRALPQGFAANGREIPAVDIIPSTSGT
jgi:glycogen(starch) synthase